MQQRRLAAIIIDDIPCDTASWIQSRLNMILSWTFDCEFCNFNFKQVQPTIAWLTDILRLLCSPT